MGVSEQQKLKKESNEHDSIHLDSSATTNPIRLLCDTVKDIRTQRQNAHDRRSNLGSDPNSDPQRPLSDTQEWDLSDLYQGFDDPKLEEDLQELDRRAQAFRSQYRGQLAHCSPSEVAIALQDLEAIHQKSGYLYAFPSLKFSADTRDSQAQQFEDKVIEALTQIENQLLFFELELQALDESQFAQLQEAEALSNYHHYLQRIAEFRPHCLPEAVEQTRNQDVLTGREAFITEEGV